MSFISHHSYNVILIIIIEYERILIVLIAQKNDAQGP